VNDRDLGEVDASSPVLTTEFKGSLLIETAREE